MSKILSMLLVALLPALTAYPLRKDGAVWIISESVPPSVLSNQLAQAEAAARGGKLVDAASILANALKLDDQGSKVYLTQQDAAGPLALQIEAARIDCLWRSPYFNKADAVQQAKSAIERYAARNREMNWSSCMELYNIVINHYSLAQNYPEMLSWMKQAFEVCPANGAAYILALFARNHPDTEVRETIEKMRKAGGTILPEIKLLECKLDRRSGKDTVTRTMALLTDTPDLPVWVFKDALNDVRAQLDVRQPERIRDFYSALQRLALIQPPDQPGMEKVQWCMQERTKLEGLVPEIVGARSAGGPPAATR